MLYPCQKGGVEVYNSKLIQYFDRQNKENIELLIPDCKGLNIVNLKKSILFERFIFRRSWFGSIAHYISFRLALKKGKTKPKNVTVYTSVTSSISNNHIYFFRILSKLGVKTVLHLHGGNLIDKRKDPLFIKFISEANLVLCVSKRLNLHFKKFNSNCKVFYPLPEFNEYQNLIEPENSFQLYGLFVGSLKTLKAPMDVLQACFLLKNEMKHKLKLTFCGDGPLKAELLEFVGQNNLESIVSIEGHVKNSKIQSYYNKANVFILSSTVEAMPISVLQALYSKMIIICTRIDATVEILGENYKFFYEVGDYVGLANCIRKVYSLLPSERMKIRGEMREIYTKNFALNAGFENLSNELKSC